MQIIAGPNVDLISPFPAHEARRVYRWMFCYKNIVETDASPHGEEEYSEYFAAVLPTIDSYAVIDKGNQLNFSHELPLIGMVAFEPTSRWNCYIHIASNRRAWHSGFMDEAITLAMSDVFDRHPDMLRVSGMVLKSNGPVHGIAKRLGFRFEGRLRDMVTQQGQPRDMIHYGMTRSEWTAILSGLDPETVPAEAERAEPALAK